MSQPDDVEHDDARPPPDRKGKQRAIIYEPSEQTPLLGGPSQAVWTVVDDAEENSSRAARTLRARLINIFVASLLVCIIAFLIGALLAWSYAAKAAGLTPQDLINNDLVFEGPHKLDLHNVTEEGGLWVTVHGKIGVDVGDAMGINSDPADGALRRWWKKLGRHSVRTLRSVSVDMSTITVVPEIHPHLTLALLNVAPLSVPLSVDPPQDGSWLTPVSVPVQVFPTNNATLVKDVLRDAWRKGRIGVLTAVDTVRVRGGDIRHPTWRTSFHGKLSHIRTVLKIKVPSIPGLPEPGTDAPFPDASQFISLDSFRLESSASKLSVSANATLTNPAPPSLQMTTPPLPFTVAIADRVTVASVTAAPFTLTHPNITLQVAGSVLPLSPAALPALSEFVARFLNGEANRIAVTSAAFPGLSVETDFPAPHPRPRLLQNVTIHGMKLKSTAGGQFLASGTVAARVVLPRGMHLNLNVSRILPDVLIFDGEVEDDDVMRRLAPPAAPLPDPLPEHAFGRLRPDDWLEASSVREESRDGESATYAVTALVKDVPLEVLPGRKKNFSDFVSKVIFKGEGAVAGLQGTSAVSVRVEGLPLEARHSRLDLEGLPFHGSVRITKKSLFEGQTGRMHRWWDSWKAGLAAP